MRRSPGPKPLFLLAILVGVILLYVPMRNVMVPVAEELWYRQVSCRLVQDAAHLLPPQGKLWFGATRSELPQSLYGMYELDSIVPGGMSIVSFYQAWGDGETHAFPDNALHNMHKAQLIPMITWEPWLSAFVNQNGKEPKSSLALITSGAFDSYIRAWARGAVRHGKPILLRLAHESTNPQYPWASAYGNTMQDYKAFWKHVRAIFQSEGAQNVAFVWTPYGLNEQEYYPGDDLVDWIGLDLFNYGGHSVQGTWMDFYSLAKLYVDQYRTLGKHLMLAEVATSSAGGNKADWIRDMLRSLCNQELPELRAIVFFDIASGTTANGLPVDWSLSEVPQVAELFQKENCQINRRYQNDTP